jgi:DNA-binding transcriptional MerR regulator
MSDQRLTIGELARRTGVATSALRYWEELGLMPRPTRISGERRYSPSAVQDVGTILLLRDVGFSLRELKVFIASSSPPMESWRQLVERKLAELDAQIARARVARDAVEHARHCPHADILQCPSFTRAVSTRLAGAPLQEAHLQ